PSRVRFKSATASAENDQLTPGARPMDSLLDTVLFPENLEYQRYLDKHVHLIDGPHDDELLVTVDNKLVASVKLAPQKMIVRDIKGTLIGFFDCPPSSLKREVLDYCRQSHTKGTEI